LQQLLLCSRACSHYLPWRNATLNGAQLSEEGLRSLQLYAIPASGTLKLDYVSYQVSVVAGGALCVLSKGTRALD
jgi:hypothetical protein